MANDLVKNKFLLDTPKILLHVSHYLGKKKKLKVNQISVQ